MSFWDTRICADCLFSPLLSACISRLRRGIIGGISEAIPRRIWRSWVEARPRSWVGYDQASSMKCFCTFLIACMTFLSYPKLFVFPSLCIPEIQLYSPLYVFPRFNCIPLSLYSRTHSAAQKKLITETDLVPHLFVFPNFD